MKNKIINYFVPFLKKEFNNYEKIADDAYIIFNDICLKNKNDSKKIKKQTEGNLFPVYSIYKALLDNNIDKAIALDFVDRINYSRKLKEAKLTSKLFHLFGLYKLYPTIFKKVTLSTFNEEVGFKPEFVIANKSRCKFNMTKCFYCQKCNELNVNELVKVFCHTDDAFNDNLHPRIIWNRTKTLGEGGDLCDFDVYIERKK